MKGDRDNMNIKEIVKDNDAHFEEYRAGNLWYTTDDGFRFPIPIEDTKGAVFFKTHRAITLMRWIRKHLVLIENA